MSDLHYLLAAYVVFWLLTFALVLSIWVRQRRLEREIVALMDKLPPDAGDLES